MDFPGNVRELSSLMERTVVLSTEEKIDAAAIYEAKKEEFPSSPDAASTHIPDAPPSEADGREAILEALRQTDGQKDKAAALLGISRATLWRRMKKLGME